ncbi:MAG: type II toxin-antitoxin system prevent-host-death family antitoxin [Dehalococcoidia bacterium]
MATMVKTHEAKTQSSRLLALVEQGEEVVIARHGKPIAKRVPAEERPLLFEFGSLKGQIKLLPGWDDPMTEAELALWYDGPLSPGGGGADREAKEADQQ